MKTVILAGGLGTRLSEETYLIPKPMVEIGGKPILWHIMKIYSYYGFNEFIVLTGYKSHVIKDYFINYYSRYSDITVDLKDNSLDIHKIHTEPWKVTMVYTGQETMTGSRLKIAQKYIGNERFFMTYGDGVSTINILELLEHHKKHQKLATLTAVQPQGKFGSLALGDNNKVESFIEKPKDSENWINTGFFVLEPEVFDYIEDNRTNVVFEQTPLRELTKKGQLNAFKHTGFWRPMDTMRDKMQLTELWLTAEAPWAKWLKQESK